MGADRLKLVIPVVFSVSHIYTMQNGWLLLGGIALFLMGTGMMEHSIRMLAGRKFKLFLKKSTSNPVKAIGSGTLVTALLQSSSVVNMFVLSLVGSGTMKMRQALAVMLGSNLGTTFTSWMIALLGFSLNLESYALPVFGISGMLMFYTANDSNLNLWSRSVAGFSLLFLGLGFMQESMQALVQHLDFSLLNGYPLIVFLITGMLITGIVQASSVTMAITLSALQINAIDMYMAASLILGAEIGTTFKLAIASYKGSAAKKRVAAGNILFNLITSLLVFFILKPVTDFLYNQFASEDHLITVVLFQTFVNFIGIFLFFPFLNYFGSLLDRLFNQETTLDYLKKIRPEETALAMEALEQEVYRFLSRFHALALSIFGLPSTEKERNGKHKSEFEGTTASELYNIQKRHYGELHAFLSAWDAKGMAVSDLERKDQLINCMRNGMYAAKSLKDAKPDIEQLSNSSNDAKYAFYKHLQKHASEFLQHFLVLKSRGATQVDELMHLYNEVQDNYQQDLKSLYSETVAKQLDAVEIATILNVHRETISGYKSAVFSLKDFLLSSKESALFDTSPGFIR